MGTGAPVSEPTPSCRLDWLSVSLFASHQDLQYEQIGFFVGALEMALGERPVLRPAGGRHFFSQALWHDAGLQIRWTPPEGSPEEGAGGVNAGMLSVDLRGTFFRLMDRDHRRALYLDIADLEGFRKATRVDCQRTLLEPQADAEQIFDLVRKRKAWVARYDGYSQLGEVDSKGQAVKGASVVWGSPQSATRCLTYNKAKEDGWDDVRAVRHEVRLRKQPARDTFTQLIELARLEEESGQETSAETVITQSVLSKSMTYFDTSRFARLKDKTEWPTNWASDSKPAPFWAEVVEGNPIELKTQWRNPKALEDSMAAMQRQYGRKYAQWVIWRMFACGQQRIDAMEEHFDQAVIRLHDDDLEELKALVPKEHHQPLTDFFRECRAVAAHNVEGGARVTQAN